MLNIPITGDELYLHFFIPNFKHDFISFFVKSHVLFMTLWITMFTLNYINRYFLSNYINQKLHYVIGYLSFISGFLGVCCGIIIAVLKSQIMKWSVMYIGIHGVTNIKV